MDSLVLQAFGSGLVGSIAQVAVIAGTLVLMMGLVAMGVYAYKNIRGDGVTWPDERDDMDVGDDDGVRKGNKDDEWDYY